MVAEGRAFSGRRRRSPGADPVRVVPHVIDSREGARADDDLGRAVDTGGQGELAAAEIAASAFPTAILFGPERSGLETEEVALAKAIVALLKALAPLIALWFGSGLGSKVLMTMGQGPQGNLDSGDR